MRPGKVSQTVYRRSILKQLHTENSSACFGIQAEGQQVLSAGATVYGNEKDICLFAVARVVNHLAAQGAEIKGVYIHFLLTERVREAALAEMTAAAVEAGKTHGFEVLGVDAEVSPVLTVPVVHVTGQGIFLPNTLRCSNMTKQSEDIVLLNWIGLEGTLRIAREKRRELSERFNPRFLAQLEGYQESLFSTKEIEAAAAIGVSAVHQITDGGILAGLWELAESSGVGFSVDMRRMTVKQETIEVCELFHLNPYQLASAGSVLVITPKGEELADTLMQQGMQAVWLGCTQVGKEKSILNGGEKRFLDRPAPDELTKIWRN